MTFEEIVLDLAHAIDNYGAQEIWRQLRLYEQQHQELLYYALEELPK